MKGIHKVNSPDVVFLMETKTPVEMVLKELQFLKMDNQHIVKPHSPGGGGLFLGWKNDVQVTILSSTNNYIDTMITYKGVSFHSTFVYGEPD